MTSKGAAQCEPVALALAKRLGTVSNSDFTVVNESSGRSTVKRKTESTTDQQSFFETNHL